MPSRVTKYIDIASIWIIILCILVFSSLLYGCSDDSASSDTPEPQVAYPLPDPPENPEAPDNYTFWAKDRRADAPTDITAFKQINAEKIAENDAFVIYRAQDQSDLITSSDGDDILNQITPSYDALKNIYGAGVSPNVDFFGKVIILALDIEDDYAIEHPSFISGYVSPRDLFADTFTTSLYDHPENIYTYGNLGEVETAANLAGHSNEAPIIYMDLNPFYNGAAYPEDPAKAKDLFVETILHEASHLFTYNRRVIADHLPNHDQWIAEGIAEQAPDLLGDMVVSQSERMDQYALPLVRSLLSQGPSLMDITSSGNALVGYLQTNLFFNYLRHRAGADAPDLFEALVLETDESAAGLDVNMDLRFTGFEDIFRDWAITNWLSATGRDLVSFIDDTGTSVDVSQQSIVLSYQGVGIGKYGDVGLSFQENALPLNYENSATILPAAYIYFSYQITGEEEEAYIPVNRGMEDGLKLALVHVQDDTAASIQLFDYNSPIPLHTYLPGETYHFIIYNPSLSGSGLYTGLLPWDTKNIASWIGGGLTGWQTRTGAAWDRGDDYFFRPTGCVVSPASVNGEADYIYVADAVNQGVSRWNMNTGAFAGRMGSTNIDYVADDSDQDGWKTNEGNLCNNYLRRSFNSPHGIAVDASGNIYIADTSNYRIIKRDKDGNFLAWLGHPDTDTWQDVNGEAPMDSDDMRAGGLGYETNTRMFNLPWDIAIDDANGFLYVSCYGSHRIVRRILSTGAYAGFIGNGEEEWNTSIDYQFGSLSSPAAAYFHGPRGIAIDADYLYVADESNHRISRWTLAGRQASADGDAARIWIGGGDRYPSDPDSNGWHDSDTAIAENQARDFLKYPSDVYVDDTYMYIADRQNQRVVRWSKADGAFAGWIGGGTSEWETEKDGPYQEPVGSGEQYPPLFMLEPDSIFMAQGTSHNYLYTTAVYNGRVSRWNMDCVEDNINGDCSAD